MNNNNSIDYMESLWNKINNGRDEFKEFIFYEWNFAVHINFHRNYETKIENVDRLVLRYLDYLRKRKKLTFSAFYIIPQSYIDPVFNPHHVHIILLVYNSNRNTKLLLEESVLRYRSINGCKVHKLYEPESGINYLTKNKNLPLTRPESFHFDFYRKQLLQKYRSPTDYINDELRMAFEKDR